MNVPFDLTPNGVEKPSKISTAGKILVGVTGGVALGLTVICASFVSPAFRKICLPYIPATKTQIDNVLLALNGRKGRLLDLGSGDGRIVFEAASRGFVGHGVELNFWLVLYSKLDSARKGLSGRTAFYQRDLWKFDVGGYDNIVIFGVGQMMADLEKKFYRECKNDCHVIACRFPLPNRMPIKTFGHGIDRVWLYKFENKSFES